MSGKEKKEAAEDAATPYMDADAHTPRTQLIQRKHHTQERYLHRPG